ncbi:hypothetical protein, partial [Burkholderia pseudomallei]
GIAHGARRSRDARGSTKANGHAFRRACASHKNECGEHAGRMHGMRAARYRIRSIGRYPARAADVARTSVLNGVITFRRPFENRGDSESEEAFTMRDNFVTLCDEACDKIKRGDN